MQSFDLLKDHIHLSYWPRIWIQAGIVSFLISAICMPIAIFLFRKFGFMDEVEENKIHTKPIARGGGIVIFLAFAVAVLLPNYRENPMNGVILGAFICLVVGAIDDFICRIPGLWKLLTLFLVTLILWHYGVRLNVFKYAPLDIIFTLLWIVGVTSSFNGMDNMDGLASGVSTIIAAIFLTIAVYAYIPVGTETSLSWFGLLAAGLIGANLGFLIYNFNPAKIFMGDSGSFFLGFTVASLGIMGEWTENRLISCTIPILILGVPLFDFTYIILVRIINGETRTIRSIIDHCAPDHLSHRLVWIGFSHRQAVLLIYVISIALGTTGFLLRNSNSLFDSAIGLLQGMAVITLVIILMACAERRHEHRPEMLEKESEKKN